MSATFAVSREKSNRVGDEMVTKNAHRDDLNDLIVKAVRKIFPDKCWFELTVLLRIAERTAKHRLARTREFSAGELAELIRSDHGLEVLEAIMADATPKWWVRFKAMVTFVDANAEARSAARKAKEAMDAIAGANAIIGQATSLLVQDAEHRRPHADAMLAVGGSTHRPMAYASKGRSR